MMDARPGQAGRNAQRQAWAESPADAAPSHQPLPVLAVAVMGVVYGDIGTSPIYALRESFAGHSPMAVNMDNVLGILSLIFWTLILVISLKYMIFVLRADNRGERGIFALLGLPRPQQGQDRRAALAFHGNLAAQCRSASG